MCGFDFCDHFFNFIRSPSSYFLHVYISYHSLLFFVVRCLEGRVRCLGLPAPGYRSPYASTVPTTALFRATVQAVAAALETSYKRIIIQSTILKRICTYTTAIANFRECTLITRSHCGFSTRCEACCECSRVAPFSDRQRLRVTRSSLALALSFLSSCSMVASADLLVEASGSSYPKRR